MDRAIAVRLPAGLAQKLQDLAEATGRPRAHVVRLLLSRATAKDLPAGWFAAVREERIAAGREARIEKKRPVRA